MLNKWKGPTSITRKNPIRQHRLGQSICVFGQQNYNRNSDNDNRGYIGVRGVDINIMLFIMYYECVHWGHYTYQCPGRGGGDRGINNTETKKTKWKGHGTVWGMFDTL